MSGFAPLKRGMEEGKKLSTRELVLRLYDELRHGIKYDRKRNIFVVVWTARQLRNARRRADRLWKGLKVE